MNIRKILLSVYQKFIKVFSGHGIGKFYIVKIIHKFVVFHLRPRFAEVHGHKMFLDSRNAVISPRLSAYGIFEPSETEIVKKGIKKGDIVLDIGAHIGYYTLIFAKLVGEKGRIFAFEPDPDNFDLLSKNITANKYQNVTLVRKGVLNKNGKAKLYLSQDNTGDHRIYDHRDSRKSIEIETIRLDDYFKNYKGRIDFIKMDIEGVEGSAIQGMFNLLNRNKDLKILTEFWPHALKEFGTDPEEYLKLLTGLGFKLYDINQKKMKPFSIQELLERYPSEQFVHTNLLCIKENS